MRKRFCELEERLLRAGVSPRHVRRYVRELTDHLADLRADEERAGRHGAEAEAAAALRLGSEEELAAAMLGRDELRSWSARAPWAVFGLGGLISLGILYFVACLILWTGWRIFLPGSPTPFGGRLEGLAVPYFGVGRMLYYWAPVLVAWGLGVIGARQRIGAVWPVVGITLACVAGAMAHVRVAAGGSVWMAIAPVSVTYWAGLMVVAGLPYLVWRAVDLSHAQSM